MKTVLRGLMIVGMTALAGCSLVPAWQSPAVALPGEWQNGAAGAAVAQPADWWMVFGSVELNRLVAQALVQNRDVGAALERIAQARAQARIAGAALLPTADLSVNTSRDLVRGGGSGGVDQRLVTSGQLSLGYELDLWGANRANLAAARANVDAARFSADSLRLTTAADMAQTYFQLLGLQERERLAEANLANVRRVLGLIEVQHRAGAVSGLEPAQQASAVASAEASLAALRQQQAAALNALALLCGTTPRELAPQLAVQDGALSAVATPAVPVQVPATVIIQRPDVAQAEANLRAAHADIGIARANFLPSVNIGVTDSFTLNPATNAAGFALNALAPIFRGGELSGNLDLAWARRRELVQTYQGVVLAAVRDVEDALAGLTSAKARTTQLAEAAAQARRADEIALLRYRSGATNYQTLLDTQRTVLQADDAAVQAQQDLLTQSVLLVRAQGGSGK